MPARRSPQGIQAHPQLKQITEALMNGESCRNISKWTKPQIGHAAIANYGKTIVRPTIARAEALKSVLPPNMIESTAVSGGETQGGQALEAGQIAKMALAAAPILAIRENRIAAQQERHRRLQMIVDDRAEDMASAPGGRSGFLARDFKGSGDNLQEVFKVDTGLLSEFREHEKQIAQELGQWQEGVGPQVAIQIVVPAGVPAVSVNGGATEFAPVEIGIRGR